jgi:signal transduction histidine kinase
MTFRARLTLTYLILLTTALSGFGLWVYAYVDRNLHQEFYGSVERQGNQLAQLLAGDYDSAIRGGADTLDRWSNEQETDTYIVVETREPWQLQLEVAAKHPPDAMADRDLPVVPPGRVVNVRPSDNNLGLPLAVYAQRFDASKAVRQPGARTPDQPKQILRLEGQVTVARSLAGVERSLRLLRTILIAGGLAVLLVAALLGLGLAAALLRPLARMRATAQRIGDERDFSHRMPVDGDPHDELGRLSLSFNQMLTELEQANLGLKTTLDSQRRFVADASHELRTPLTAIRTNVEFLARVPGARTEDRVEALRDVLTELRRMESLVGDLLALARLEAAVATPARRSFRLDHMLADVHRDAMRMATPEVEVRLEPGRQRPQVHPGGQDRPAPAGRGRQGRADRARHRHRHRRRPPGPRVRPLLAGPERPRHDRVGPRPGHHPLGRPGPRGDDHGGVGGRERHHLRPHPAGRPGTAQALPAPRGRAARRQPGDRFGTSFLRAS